jgi:hypothetical protein
LPQVDGEVHRCVGPQAAPFEPANRILRRLRDFRILVDPPVDQACDAPFRRHDGGNEFGQRGRCREYAARELDQNWCGGIEHNPMPRADAPPLGARMDLG